MTPDASEMRRILRHNHGFTVSDFWVEYGIRNSFSQVSAINVPLCPDCSAAPRGSPLGQFVHYSTLVRLLRCPDCDLVWADQRIDPAVLNAHFELVYKGEEYFGSQREAIFGKLIELIDSVAPVGGAVLDVGGAEGHLMARLRERRQDLRCVVNDVSTRATQYAQTHFGLDTLCGAFSSLRGSNLRFDVVVASDVVYYEADLNSFWETVDRLLQTQGTLILRLPNKLRIVMLIQMLRGVFLGKARIAQDDRIAFFNTEHAYILGSTYVLNRLTKQGFSAQALPSPLLFKGPLIQRLTVSAWHRLAVIVAHLTSGRVLLTPSILIIARRGG